MDINSYLTLIKKNFDMNILDFLKRKKFLGLITRCKDEFFVAEFAEYYLNEGVDHIYIIDDNSHDKGIYKEIENHKKITVIYEKDIIKRKFAKELYKKIKNQYKWMIYIDVDEFITTRKNKKNTIRKEIKKNFSDVDCIKIPWVMMSSNGIEKNPESLLKTNIWRWDHDKKPPHKIKKFQCRYDQIEMKSIFKTDCFSDITDHHPIPKETKEIKDIKIINSIDKKEVKIISQFKNLREEKIEDSFLICHHYRIISKENNTNKIKNNIWYKNEYTIDDLEKSDYAEIVDETIKKRILNKKFLSLRV